MRILVTFALDAEFAPWRKLRPFQKNKAANVDHFSAQVSGSQVDVLLTGVGAKGEWLDAAQEMYDSEIDICISSGLAGGLRAEHQIGEILVAEKVLAGPRDITAFSDASLVSSAVAAGAKRVSTFYTADRVVLHAEEKHALGAFADAVEMESFGVLLESGMFAARTAGIRAISDTADEDLPLDFNKVTDSSGELSPARILGEVLGAPGSIPALIRFGQQSKSAAESLAKFFERFLPLLVMDSNTTSIGSLQ